MTQSEMEQKITELANQTDAIQKQLNKLASFSDSAKEICQQLKLHLSEKTGATIDPKLLPYTPTVDICSCFTDEQIERITVFLKNNISP